MRGEGKTDDKSSIIQTTIHKIKIPSRTNNTNAVPNEVLMSTMGYNPFLLHQSSITQLSPARGSVSEPKKFMTFKGVSEKYSVNPVMCGSVVYK
jgi:hypothetical protein